MARYRSSSLLVPSYSYPSALVIGSKSRQPIRVNRFNLDLRDGNDFRVDWLLWQGSPLTSLQVPSFTTANFVAIRGQRSSTVRVRQSTTLEEPLDWFEMDRRVANWLFTKGPKPLSSQEPTAEHFVRQRKCAIYSRSSMRSKPVLQPR